MHYFFVPYRLVWEEWEDFITGGREGTANPVFPRFYLPSDIPLASKQNALKTGSLADYLGFPVKNLKIDNNFSISQSLAFSQLPFRAYHTIYNEYYRDQNLEDEIDVSKGSGIDKFSNNLNTNEWILQAPIS